MLILYCTLLGENKETLSLMPFFTLLMNVGPIEEPRKGITRPAQCRYHLTSQNRLSLGLPHHPWTLNT